MNKPWSGRFTKKTAKVVEAYTESISFDNRLWRYDILGSIAHAQMLSKQGIISKEDGKKIVNGLQDIYRNIENGDFKFSIGLEDIHMNIESALIEKIGEAGARLHTARSRNDQVALDLRMYLRDETHSITALLDDLKRALITLAEQNIDTIIPGYTHTQRAQPVLLSHHLLAYVEMFDRDKGRLVDSLKRLNVLPLGSCALAGTSLPIDRRYVAKSLGFEAVSRNSMDAVSDRDFVLEFLSVAAIMMMHISRFSEELILWSSTEFGFIEISDAFTTGSSIMPQKKNPDVAELMRGKTGRVYGSLMAMLTVMKALPLTYNRDMQEDKEPLFDTVDTLKMTIEVLIKMLPKIKFNTQRLTKSASDGFATATDIAEYLVKKGIAFRKAHEITGKIVHYCIKKGKELKDLSLEEFSGFSEAFDKDIFDHLSPQSSVANRRSFGSASVKEVKAQIKYHKKRLNPTC
jgi:argininosuccinate lyase